MTRRRSVEIYLKEGIPNDDTLYEVWSSLKEYGRPQDIFRRMLSVGLQVLLENGELPSDIVETIHKRSRIKVGMAHETLLGMTETSSPKAPPPPKKPPKAIRETKPPVVVPLTVPFAKPPVDLEQKPHPLERVFQEREKISEVLPREKLSVAPTQKPSEEPTRMTVNPLAANVDEKPVERPKPRLGRLM